MAEPERSRESRSLSGVPKRRGREGRRRIRILAAATRVVPPLLLFVALVASWHVTVVALAIPEIVLPTPAAVANALVALGPTLLADVAVTGTTAATGLLAGCAVGGVLAFAMTYSRTAARIALPYVIALRVAPLIAVAPLVFLWFGRGIPARAALVATLTLFPMTVATLDGLRSTPERYLALARSVDASKPSVFLRMRVPAAAPSVFAGLKLAATLSIVGSVVAEFVTLRAGIGYRVFVTAQRLRTAETYAALVALSALGVAFYLVPALLERALWTE
ncbi:ABC transporter permease [Halorubrum lipolyticum]|uniref:Binding-protein-dependent transport systems inner membrane component n=1 Tax=Halorubrum lipolyticum DSM 21995 TaxID=1227482 RepID=M0NQ08_9EURY|nr:ABC transporter permease [Halorubrum lipolyticum]EMA59846.1 binding-protein-dependent transport systems inner membrane component [Halorubrum lipolyticum DSM 21995]